MRCVDKVGDEEKKKNDQEYTAIALHDNPAGRESSAQGSAQCARHNKKSPHGKPCGLFTSLVKQPGPLAAAGSASLN